MLVSGSTRIARTAGATHAAAAMASTVATTAMYVFGSSGPTP
jgi:hypothetical protein